MIVKRGSTKLDGAFGSSKRYRADCCDPRACSVPSSAYRFLSASKVPYSAGAPKPLQPPIGK